MVLWLVAGRHREEVADVDVPRASVLGGLDVAGRHEQREATWVSTEAQGCWQLESFAVDAGERRSRMRAHLELRGGELVPERTSGSPPERGRGEEPRRGCAGG